MLKLSESVITWASLKGLATAKRYLNSVLHAEKLIDQADQILRGEGGPDRNWRDALEVYQAAGELGSGTAYQRMGDLYADGKHTEIDLQKSLLNYHKSADLGCISALSSLAVTYTLLKDYDNTIYSWEKYFKYLDIENIEDDCIEAKAIFYLLLKIRNKDRFNTYKCFLKNSESIVVQINEDIKKIINSISREVKNSVVLQNSEEFKKSQLKIGEQINDVEDLKICKNIFVKILSH